MTPAKLLALEQERNRDIELLTFPIDKLAWIYANAHRDPGEKDEHGRVIRPPAEPLDIDDFRTYGRKLKSLAAKDWNYALQGAKANRVAFESWAGSKSVQEFIPVKE